jgi:hypothetical protein
MLMAMVVKTTSKKQTQAELLVTLQEKLDLVNSITSKSDHTGQIFSPNDSFYLWDEPVSGLQNMHNQLAHWIGLKKRALKVSFNPRLESSGKYLVIDGQATIQIHSKHAANQFHTAAILAHFYSHYMVDTIVGNASVLPGQLEEIVDLTSIYLGFGVLILNAYSHQTGLIASGAKRLRSALSGTYLTVLLGYFQPVSFAKQFIDFCHNYRILPESYSNILLPGAKKLLKNDAVVNNYSTNLPNFIKVERQNIRTSNIRFATSIICCMLLIGAVIFVVNQLPKPLSEQLKSLQEKAQLLHHNYDVCQQRVADERGLTDNSDLFVEQKNNADENRCTSIRNQYNSVVDQYNQASKH